MRFDPTITQGNLITIVGGFISFLLALWRVGTMWQRTKDEILAVIARLDKQEKGLDELNRTSLVLIVNQHERRIGDVEKAVQVLPAIQTNLDWIKQKLTE